MPKRGEINPLTGKTDGKLNQSLRSALRIQWGYTVKATFVKGVRYKKDGKRFHVKCEECGLEMAIADKQRPVNKDGTLSKRKPQKLFDVDHVDGITPLVDPIKGLAPYWESMMTGPLQILCKPCHAEKTAKQATQRSNSK
jgi:hypothetical protein